MPLAPTFFEFRSSGAGRSASHAPFLSTPQLQQVQAEDVLEAGLGFPLFTEGEDKLGWLMTMSPVSAGGGAVGVGWT